MNTFHRTTLNLLLFATGISLYSQSFAQNKFTISGTIVDHESGETLIGANVHVPELNTGASTNTYGFYSLTLATTDSILIVFTYVGYITQIKKVLLDRDLKLEIQLKPDVDQLQEVVIQSTVSDENVERPQMGVVDIPINKIRELPFILGEPDVLKIIQLLPGVQVGNEGSTGYHVRGGNVDQNLVLLDEATIYNPNHLFGLFSTFNSKALNNVTFISGGFPAYYGGRLSSILDVTMKDGNNQKFGLNGGIGLISSHLTVEGPIIKDKASYIVSSRRTYLDLIIKPFLPPQNDSDYQFYDLNGKINWKINAKDRIYLSFFYGKDNAYYKEIKGINYRIAFGNSTATLRWNHLFNSKLFLNTSLIYNIYQQNIAAAQDNYFSQVYTGINDINGKIDFEYFPNPDHLIRFGALYTNHRFLAGVKSEINPNIDLSSKLNIDNAEADNFHEYAIYINDEFKISRKLAANIGIRVPGYISQDVKYNSIEPRTSLKFGLTSSSSIKAAYTLMNQYLHQIPSSTASVPTDIWIPSTKQTKPQLSQQVALGYFRNFKENTIESSVELYYKTMDNQVLFKEGNQLVENFDIDSSVVYGNGWSYGAEFFIKKNTGKLTGWIAYTLSKTQQQFDDLNFGNSFDFKYDRTHVFSIVGSYAFNNRWTLSGVFVFSTGGVYTQPVERINVYHGPTLFEGNYLLYYERNNARLNNYHRLDVSLSYKKAGRIFKKPFESEWVFGVYNLYNHQNPYFVYFKIDPWTNKPTAVQVSLFPIIPSVSYNFKF
jgi:hypothetical protein